MEIESIEHILTQKQISNHLGFSDSTIKRYGDDFNMASPQKRKTYQKKTNESKITRTETQTHLPTRKVQSTENTKNNKKNDISKGGSNLEDQDEKRNMLQ